MDQRIVEYIRGNRGRYTREAITQQLVQAGYERDAIDAAWQGTAADEQGTVGAARNLSNYVWIIYWVGAGIILAITVIATLGSGGGTGFVGFGLGWLVAYLLLTYLPARALARARPTGAGGAVVIILAVPLLVVLIGGGICLGTIAVIAASLGG